MHVGHFDVDLYCRVLGVMVVIVCIFPHCICRMGSLWLSMTMVIVLGSSLVAICAHCMAFVAEFVLVGCATFVAGPFR